MVTITDRSILPAVLLGFAGTYGIALAFHFGTLPNAENPAGGFAITLSNLAPFFLWLGSPEHTSVTESSPTASKRLARSMRVRIRS